MKRPTATSLFARLRALALALLLTPLLSLAPATLALAASPIVVTDCSGQTGPGRIGTVIGSATAGDTIQFSCSGSIPISSTLTISQDLTLDGSGQTVTLDGGDSTQVLFVNSGVSFTLNALTIAHGSAGGGGGLADIASTVRISNSTFANNSSPGGGGGLFNVGGTLSISNSTFANNSANNVGGGLLTETGGIVRISNSTFANNSANNVGGLFNVGSTVSVGGSIVANNSGGNCLGVVLDQGYNLESGTDCGFTGTGDLQNTDPKLDPNGLQNNGGRTQTLALEPDSAAVDHIPMGSSCPATDQRGVSRPQGSMCDIGAFEMTAADGVTVMIHVVNSLHLSASLQNALDNKLHDVLTAITAGQTATACSELSDFIGFVQSHTSKGITQSQAKQLIAAAMQVQAVLGC
jgi:hypothetical protein